MAEMLVAIASGVVDAGGEVHEITAGKSRIAPEVLDREPQYADFFERGHSAAGTDSERTIRRVIDRDGRMHAA